MIRSTLGSARRYLLNRTFRPAIVLLYHRVTNLTSDPQQLAVSPDNFYDHIDLLKKKYNLMEIEEFSGLLASGKKMPDRSVIVTFDDGYSDNYHEALPILQSLKSQALFYITTSNLNSGEELWWDEIERILLGELTMPNFVELTIREKLTRFPTSSLKERLTSYRQLHPHLKYSPPLQRNKLIDSIRRAVPLKKQGRSSHRVLTTKELKLLASSPSAVIGAHTHNHPALSILTYRQQLEEIRKSKDILEKTLRKKIEHFSYPYGSRNDYNGDSVKACEKLGFKMACSNYYGHVNRWTDCLQVPRVLVRNWDKSQFEKQLIKTFKY